MAMQQIDRLCWWILKMLCSKCSMFICPVQDAHLRHKSSPHPQKQFNSKVIVKYILKLFKSILYMTDQYFIHSVSYLYKMDSVHSQVDWVDSFFEYTPRAYVNTQFSIIVVLIYIHSNSVYEFSFLHMIISMRYLQCFYQSSFYQKW